jgi:dynein heavy chain
MDIVLFKDAIIHVTKIIRVINLKRGHAMLVGVGGSGRHSLSRLSSFMSTMMCDQLEIRKDFNLKDFRIKLREMYERVGFRDKEARALCFIFADNDVVQETFLEDVQNMLNSGIVPNIYTADELANLRSEMVKMYKIAGNTNETPDAMNEWFYNRIKDNVHLSILMSPVGETFRSYCRQYPALINNTTIDWFMAWPYEALIEVANNFLGELELPDDKRFGLAALAAYTHSTTDKSTTKMYNELKRIFYVTPTNFIELLKGYSSVLSVKRTKIGTQIDKLRKGLTSLEEARDEVKVMAGESEIKRQEVTKKTSECETLLQEVAKETKDANEKQVVIDFEKKKIE